MSSEAFLMIFVAMILAMITFNVIRLTIVMPVIMWWGNRRFNSAYVSELEPLPLPQMCSCKNCGYAHPKMPPMCECSDCGVQHPQGGHGFLRPFRSVPPKRVA